MKDGSLYTIIFAKFFYPHWIKIKTILQIASKSSVFIWRGDEQAGSVIDADELVPQTTAVMWSLSLRAMDR